MGNLAFDYIIYIISFRFVCMKRTVQLEIQEALYRKWKKRASELGYMSIEKYIEDLIAQDIEHDFCEEKLG